MAQYPPFRTSGTVPASGVLTLTFRARGNETYRCTQATAEMTGGAAAICALRLNGGLISPMVSTGGAAAGDPPIWVGPGDDLTVEWTSATPGLIGKMLVIYDLGPGPT